MIAIDQHRGAVVPSGSDHLQRVRQFALADAATAFAGAALALATHLFSVSSPYLVLIAVLCVVAALVMLGALWPLRHGDVVGGLLWLTAANWMIALAAAAITTFVWPLMVLAALLPAVLAPTFVGRERLAWFVVPSVAVAFAAAVLGLYQDFSGVSDEAPAWLKNLVLAVAVPVFGAFIALIGLQHNLELQTALDDANDARSSLEARTEELVRSRARVVAAADVERQRIERNLHDGAQQRLTAVRMKIRQAARLATTDPAALDGAFADVLVELATAHDELRTLAQGLFPPVLSEHGLAEALRSAADRSTVPVTMRLNEVGRFGADAEAAVYFCCTEAMQNAAKHADAGRVRLEVGRDGDDVWFVVGDDGAGFDVAQPAAGVGLLNMEDRIAAAGGTIEIASRPGGGCVVRGSVPLHG